MQLTDMVDVNDELKANNGVEGTTLRMLSYNIWFDFFQESARMQAIAAILLAEDADVVCLNEVTDQNWDMLMTYPWFERYRDQCSREGGGGYYTMLCVHRRRSLAGKIVRKRFKGSKQGRDNLYARVIYNENSERKVAVFATTHFESLEQNSRERISQVKQSMQDLTAVAAEARQATGQPFVSIFIMGDTNLRTTENKELQLAERGFVDAWLTFPQNSEENGSTRPEHKDKRYDRVFARVQHPSQSLTQMRIIGREKFALPDSPTTQILPSDHYAVVLDVLLPS